MILFNEYSLDYWMKLSSKVAQKSCEVCSQSQIGYKDRAFSWNKRSLCRTIYCFMRKIPFRVSIIISLSVGFSFIYALYYTLMLSLDSSVLFSRFTNAYSWFIIAFYHIHSVLSWIDIVELECGLKTSFCGDCAVIKAKEKEPDGRPCMMASLWLCLFRY